MKKFRNLIWIMFGLSMGVIALYFYVLNKGTNGVLAIGFFLSIIVSWVLANKLEESRFYSRELQRKQKELQSTLQKIEENEGVYNSLFESNNAVMLLIDPKDGHIMDGNLAACSFYGYSIEELKSKKVFEINTLPKDEIFKEMKRAKNTKKKSFNFRHRLASGEIRDVETYSGVIKVKGKKLLYSIIHDITERRKAEQSLKAAYIELQQIFDIATDGLSVISKNYEILRANKAYSDFCGLTVDEVIGKKCYEVFSNNYCFTDKCPLSLVATGEPRVQQENEIKKDDGSHIYYLITSVPFTDENGQVIGILKNIKDTTEQRKNKEKIDYMAHHDPLTGLLNRYSFNKELERALEDCKSEFKNLAVMFIDLDGFKLINDNLGHDAGDLVLQQSAQRLKKSIRKGDIISRHGGDEFIILMQNITKRETVRIAERITVEFAIPFNIKGSLAVTTPSIGISLYPQDGQDGITLIKKADAAMYVAKEKGKNGFRLYSNVST